MDWTQTHVQSTFGVCWGGMAMINHFHGVPKHILPAKAFGCFRQQNLAPASPYLRGFSDDCVIPVSRWTEMRADEIEAAPGLTHPARLAPTPAPAWSTIRRTGRSTSSTISNTTPAR